MGRDGLEGLGKGGNPRATWDGLREELLYLEVKLPTMINRFLSLV